MLNKIYSRLIEYAPLKTYSHLTRYTPFYLWLLVGCVAFGKHYSVHVNFRDSLPGTVFLIEKEKSADLAIGELAAFLYNGKAFYRENTIFVKIVTGKAGSIVEAKPVEQGICDYFVDGVYTGRNKLFSQAGMYLKPSQAGVIPKDHFYMYATNPNSLDSRYEIVGLVPRDHIIGRAHKIF